MKRHLLILVILAARHPCAASSAPLKKTVRFMDADEQAVLAELNLARTKPKEYVNFLEDYRKKFRDDKTVVIAKRVTMKRKEGVKAVDEAIAFLKKARPLRPLEPSEGLTQAARDHVEDTGPKGVTGHSGTDGSKSEQRMNRYGKWLRACGENVAYGPRDARFIVIQLIVDDGVPSRGHRKNIYDTRFKTVGLAMGPHKTFGSMCVMDFADGYTESASKLRKRRKR